MHTLIALKGFADILVAIVLTVHPALIYHSTPARLISTHTGLHLTSADAAPGFNQAIACMVAAVGIAHVVAARCGPAARPPILAMNASWALLNFATCATPHARATGLASASQLFSACNHAVFSVALYISERDSQRKRD
ncbi:hypothetical protein HGRIS_012419 [Hohenbuehelia grisea]|uniref:Uncharacterized protein n=1 Tax=Hohenbuehelia grisea TaxID=104357 RepID=A0ABR3IS67_9AGAR